MTKAQFLFRIINLWPPYLGAGIQVLHRESDAYTIRVRMRLLPWNRNLFGTHFGGSLYSMCDPFFAILLVRHLGAEYVVWDRSASIQFVRPGRGTVRADFRVSEEEVASIRARADGGERLEPVFYVEVQDETGERVAVVEKRLYVRRKEPQQARSPA